MGEAILTGGTYPPGAPISCLPHSPGGSLEVHMYVLKLIFQFLKF